MMLRSPLPAAAASHTASHVSLSLFFFFLTSARGGAATARPLTSPLLARPRPGRGGGEGRGRPRRERVPRARRPRGCGGEGPQAAAADGGGGPGGEPASKARDGARPPRQGARLGASLAPARGRAEMARWFLSLPQSPSALPPAKGGPAEAPRAKGSCIVHL
ncbi:uncharacterized protein LOC144616134 [Panthera onca]